MQKTRLQDPIILAAGTWLAAGAVLYGLTPLPLHADGWGWTLAFWALAAPAIVLFARHLFKPAVASAPVRPRARRVRTTAPARSLRRPAFRSALFRKPERTIRSGCCEKSGQGWPR
ncbi:MAG: hypothetical protein ACREPH_11850 [Rhodanobacteraceae bacterium]